MRRPTARPRRLEKYRHRSNGSAIPAARAAEVNTGRAHYRPTVAGAGTGVKVPSELPGLATIIGLVVISRDRQMQALHFSASLAKPFRLVT